MSFYKFMSNGNIVDIAENPRFVRFTKSGKTVGSELTGAHGVYGYQLKTLYSIAGRPKKSKVALQEVTLHKIQESEYSALVDKLEKSDTPWNLSPTLAAVRKHKIEVFSSICQQSITNGVKVSLSDGKEHKFRLTAEDQLNLLGIENALNRGETSFIYHATDEACRIYSKEDMARVVKAFKAHTLYHTTYFNIAKQYINTLDNVRDIDLFIYGEDLSGFVTDSVLKSILRNKGVV